MDLVFNSLQRLICHKSQPTIYISKSLKNLQMYFSLFQTEVRTMRSTMHFHSNKMASSLQSIEIEKSNELITNF